MNRASRIYVAGHTGLVGSALVRLLRKMGYHHLIMYTFDELDLRSQQAVDAFFAHEQPEYVFLAAARVGGIAANMHAPADFLYDNLMIAAHVISAAYRNQVRKLVFLGSSCIYPRECTQPIQEQALLSGPLEPTNEAYAIAKIAGLKLCEAYATQYHQHGTQFIRVMPTNLYGENDSFNPETAHVIPALIARTAHALAARHQTLTIWGSGTARREFLYVDDLADALLHLMQLTEVPPLLNIGTGVDYSIAEIAQLITREMGFRGQLLFDPTYPEGTPRKCLDISKIEQLGWKPKISLIDGLRKTITWYYAQKKNPQTHVFV